MSNPVEIVTSIYENFASGNIPAILEVMSDDVDWIFFAPKTVPFAGEHRGKDGVLRFFQLVGQSVAVQAYEPREMLEGQDHVTVLGWQRVTATKTGRTWETNFCHVWSLRDGKCVRAREYYDTDPMVDAFEGPRAREAG
jgi:ketosteroid isomerase-like protein